MIRAAIFLLIFSLMARCTAHAGNFIYQKPLLPNPVNEARFYIYDPATNSDRNITWSDLKDGVLTIQSNGDVQTSPKLVVKDSSGAVKLIIDAAGNMKFK